MHSYLDQVFAVIMFLPSSDLVWQRFDQGLMDLQVLVLQLTHRLKVWTRSLEDEGPFDCCQQRAHYHRYEEKKVLLCHVTCNCVHCRHD